MVDLEAAQGESSAGQAVSSAKRLDVVHACRESGGNEGEAKGRSVVVPDGVTELPLAVFLHETWGDLIRSMSAARRLCRGLQRQVLVNGEPGACSMKVSAGDVVEWPWPPSLPTPSPPGSDHVDSAEPAAGARESSDGIPGVAALYEDSDLLAFSKPAGVLAHPSKGAKTNEATMHDVGLAGGALGAVHRLDRETSGILLFAKSAEAIRSLQATWSDHAFTTKEYVALVEGAPSQPQWTVDEPLRKLRKASDVDRRRRTRERLLHEDSSRIVFRDDDALQSAATSFRLLGVLACGLVALVSCRLQLGGRTHQIRRHLQSCGHSVIGDTRYGSAATNSRMRQRFGADVDGASGRGSGACSRLFLHAWRLRVRHPTSGEPVLLEAPVPPDFDRAVRGLDGGPAALARLVAPAEVAAGRR